MPPASKKIFNILLSNLGYGNVSPHSDWGKLITIVYAIIGMPLFLLYLSNIGDVLAKSFKWLYSKLCLCRICPGVARRRILRERRKLRQLAIKKFVCIWVYLWWMCIYSSNYNVSWKWTDIEKSRAQLSTSSTPNAFNSDILEKDSISFLSLNTLYSELQESLFGNDLDDIECEIQGNTDEITVPLTVCVFIMIRLDQHFVIVFLFCCKMFVVFCFFPRL